MTTAESRTTILHPLDPLSADEFRLAAQICRREQGVDERWRFASRSNASPGR